jgi:hypothetical protein
MNHFGYSKKSNKPVIKPAKSQSTIKIQKSIHTPSRSIFSKRNTQKLMRSQSKRKMTLYRRQNIIIETKRHARRIIAIVNDFLTQFKIFKEFYKSNDTYIIYLYVIHKHEKIYFLRTLFSIREIDLDDIDMYAEIFTQNTSKRHFNMLIEELIKKGVGINNLYIHTTHCIVNGYNFATIIQSYIMSKFAILKNVFIAEKDDMTDMAKFSSMRNFNHFLGFFNKGDLELHYDDNGNELIRATDSTKFAYLPKSLEFISHNLHEKIHANEQKNSLSGFSNYAANVVSKYNERSFTSTEWKFTPPVDLENAPIEDESIFWTEDP